MAEAARCAYFSPCTRRRPASVARRCHGTRWSRRLRRKGLAMNDMTQDAEDILGQVEAWREAGEQVALATVVATWGSSPRPAGSQMAVTATGRMAGSVSGGCIEGAVAEAALEV